MKIGLFGMYGLYNYGCEAIARGTYALLKQAWPECEIILYTNEPEGDKKALSDLDIRVKKIPIKRMLLLRRVINKALRSTSIPFQLGIWDENVVANECDVVFSVGGDIYTIPKSTLNQKKVKKHSLIVEFGNRIMKSKPYVIWGASIGPFGDNLSVVNYYFNHLKKVSKIFCREEKTFHYLKNNGVYENVQLCSDPAFYVENNSKNQNYKKSKMTRIGLNVSPLSIREQIGDNYNAFKEDIINTIIDILSINDVEIALVPHVVYPLSREDDDLSYMLEIFKDIPDKFKRNVFILKDADGFLGTKKFLGTCDVVIAARMHCAVNAVCEGVPTIFLTYSQKGLGMANHIYGNTKWALPLLNIREDLKVRTEAMLSDKHNISAGILTRLDEIKNEESQIIEMFRSILL